MGRTHGRQPSHRLSALHEQESRRPFRIRSGDHARPFAGASSRGECLLGFTRVESPDEGAGDDAAPRAPLGRAAPNWVPATQVHGEGIFIRFNSDALKVWAERPP